VRAGGGRGPAAARVVHLLVSERAFDADGSDVLYQLLPEGAGHLVSADCAEEPQAAAGAVIPGVRIRAAQADLCVGGRGDVPFVLPPGVAGRAVRRPAGAALRVSRRLGGVALNVLPVHYFRGGSGPELHPADHVDGGEDHEEAAGGAGGALNVWAVF